MPFDVTVQRSPGYARYAVSGRTSLSRFARLIAGIAEDVDQFEDDRVLVDLRSVSGRLSTSEQQMVGELIAAALPMVFKLASIVPAGEITRNSERAAVKAGLQVKVFDNEAGALAWLLEGAAR